MISGELDQKAFARRAILCVVLYVIASAVMPYLLMLLISAACPKDSGNCMKLMFLNLLTGNAIYLLFALSCAVIIVKRLRKLDLPISLAAIPLVFFLADLQPAASLGNKLAGLIVSGGVFVGGIASFLPSRYLLLALLCMLFLALVPDRDRSGQSQLDRWGAPGFMMLGMLILFAISACFAFLRTASVTLFGLAASEALSGFTRYYFLYGNIVIILALAVVTARRQMRPSS